jgi:hypothetical protein
LEDEFITTTTTTMISIYNTIDKMNFDKNIYNAEIVNPGFYPGRLTIKVHEYRR